MKKLLSLLTSAVVITACALSVTACGGNSRESHTTHTWSYTYTEDGDRHYQTCDGCDEKKYGNHDYGTSGVCVCGKHKPEEIVAVTGVTLNKNTLTLEIGGTETLIATIAPENVTDKSVTWESDKTNIATVDNTGKVTAVAEGTATITAKTANGKTATCTVTVNKAVIAVESVTLNKTELTLYVGETETLTASVAPDNATDRTVTYTVEPAGVVSVENGVVTAIKDGTATITATAGNEAATCSVTVNAPITNAQVYIKLCEFYRDTAVKSCFSSAFKYDRTKVSNEKWNLTTSEKNQIVSANYGFTHETDDGNGWYALTEVVFETPIDIQKLVNGTFPTATYKRLYRVNYDANIQENRKVLCDAICEKVFTRPEGAVVQNRYIIDNGVTSLDSYFNVLVNMFEVIEVTDKGVQEANVNIKSSSSDTAYIERLENENDYRVFNKSSVSITGTLVPNNDEPF